MADLFWAIKHTRSGLWLADFDEPGNCWQKPACYWTSDKAQAWRTSDVTRANYWAKVIGTCRPAWWQEEPEATPACR